MLRFGQSARVLIQTYHSRLLSTSQLLCKKNDDSQKSKKSNIQDLLSSMEESSTEPVESLQSLMKNIKTKQQLAQTKKQTRMKLKKQDVRKHKEGEHFWFRQEESKLKLESNIAINDDTEQLENMMPEEDLTSRSIYENYNIEVSQELQVSQLKDDILQRGDSRSVSKLMTALIDEIDEDLPNPEEKLKTLMNAMSKKAPEKSFQEEEQSTSLHDVKQRRRGVSLTFGETTNLFSGKLLQESTCVAEKVFLLEKKWQDDLQSLLPESIPQNSFEESMLDIDRQWRFPIDNEQDIGIEEETTFDQHVFLEYLLDELPGEGPIRKFMELVVTGLQQNPYLTVEEKESRVFWFRDYFQKFPEQDIML